MQVLVAVPCARLGTFIIVAVLGIERVCVTMTMESCYQTYTISLKAIDRVWYQYATQGEGKMRATAQCWHTAQHAVSHPLDLNAKVAFLAEVVVMHIHGRWKTKRAGKAKTATRSCQL
jgi:hypothetical protein